MDEFKVQEIVVETLDAAKRILTAMHNRIDTYGCAFVDDLYAFVGIPNATYREHLFGWTTTHGMGYEKNGEVYWMTFPKPIPIPSTDANAEAKLNGLDVVFKNYATRAEVIYRNQTAGDFTWEGFLSCFLADAKKYL